LVIIGVQPVDWYNKSGYWPFILLSAYLWKYVGYNCLIYFAGLTVIDSSYYEAADILGASKLQKIRYITIPFLKPLVIIMFLLQLGKIFYSDFGLFYFLPMNNGVLYDITDVLDTYIFRAVRVTGDITMASAVNFFQSVIGFVVIATTNYFVKKLDSDFLVFSSNRPSSNNNNKLVISVHLLNMCHTLNFNCCHFIIG